jgi:HD superfamily phosphohydrolase
VDNLRFVMTSGHFQLVATTAATSALESYFLERYRVWRWLVFHHSVVRGEVALSRALTILLEIFFDTSNSDMHESAIRAILESSNFNRLWSPFAAPETYRAYVACDEPWLLSLFRRLQQRLGTSALPRKLAMLRIYLDFVLDRRKSTFVTLWKRAEEYEEFADAVHDTFRRAVSRVGKKSSQLKKIRKNENESSTEWFNRVIINWLSASHVTGEIETMRQYENSIQEALKKHKVILSAGALLLKPLHFSTIIDSMLIDKGGNLLRIEDLSSVVENLPAAWNKDMQLRAYWVSLKQSGTEFISGDSPDFPARKQLGKVFLSAVLGGTSFDCLKPLVR